MITPLEFTLVKNEVHDDTTIHKNCLGCKGLINKIKLTKYKF
jgi:hypothetical protein